MKKTGLRLVDRSAYFCYYLIMLEIVKLRKNLNNTRVLYDINLNVEKRDIVAIIGSSGCGKSTLLKCINRLLKPDGGKIVFNGEDITQKSTNLQKIREKIGIVFQQFNLFPHMTVKENITLAPLKVKRMPKNTVEIDAMYLLERIGMLEKMDKYPHELSGGQAQRVAIARSLIMKPELMLFDEPTSALDPKMTKEVLDVMTDLKNTGMTMIVVTHEIGFAREVANRVVFMHGGTIVEENSSDEFFSNPQHPATIDFLKNVVIPSASEGMTQKNIIS